MAVEVFDIPTFEAALPKNKDGTFSFKFITNPQLGEYCWYYISPTNPKVRLFIRSSIGPDGRSAGTGQNSIRIYIQINRKGNWVNIGKGPDAYTTRVAGWEGRLRSKIKNTIRRACRIKGDFKDGYVGFVKKQGINFGRPYTFDDGKNFVYLDR
jgi:hypothetical protein